jgi:hypothetical protein
MIFKMQKNLEKIQLNGVVDNFMPDLSRGKKEDLAKIVKISTGRSGFFFFLLFGANLDKSKFLEILT